MNGGGHQAIDDVSFWNNGIDYDAAEDVVVLPQVHYHCGCFGNVALHVNGGNGGIGFADVEAGVFQSFLKLVYYIPEFFAELRLCFEHFEALQVADGDRHGKAFREDLGAGVIANVVDDRFVACHEGTDGGHGFGEGREIEIDLVLYALFFTGAGAGLTEGAEAVGVVYEETELVLFFEGCDLFQLALVAGHTEYAFGDDEDAACVLFFDESGGALKLFFAVFDVVVLEYVSVSGVQSQSVDDAGVAFGVVYDNVMTAADGVDGAHDTLISIIEEGGVFLTFESGQLSFELFVVVAVSAHHAGTHGGCHAELGGGFCVYFAYFRVISEAKVVVKAPNYFFFSAEFHAAADLTFEFGEGEVTVCSFSVLTYRAIVLD